jgi:predicted DNA-binding transcriptional regulator AlpA
MMKRLLNTGGVATVLGVSRSRVSQLVSERADFPAPYAYTDMGNRAVLLWTPEAIDKWSRTADRQPGNPSLRKRVVD